MNGTAELTSARRSKTFHFPFQLAAALLLVLHFAMTVGSKLQESTTSDELAHLTAGVSYWENNDYRLHPENGVLPQRWAALPWVITGSKFPPLAGNDYWRMSYVWLVGYQFFYETGQDHFPRLMAGRAMIALFSVATGLLVFHWSRRLFGDTGALISLLFYVFCPTFLAHGALATSDVCMAFFFLAASGAWWWHLHDGRARVWWLSAVTLGLAFVAKFSAVLLPPIMVLIAAVRIWNPQPLSIGGRTFSTPFSKLAAAALSAAGQAVIVAVVIWAFYGFRYSAFNPALPPADHFLRPWDLMESDIGRAGSVIHALRNLHALPEGFLYGLAYVIKTTATRAAFLNGEYSVTGWPAFFPWAFLLKTTVPLMLACPLALWIAARCRDHVSIRRGIYCVTPLIVLFAVYWLTSLTSHLNIGHRHLLPTYPVLFIMVGSLGTWLTSEYVVRKITIAALLCWHVAASIGISPHYLAYFNAIGGGPANGWRHLVDSSLDWGQDLPSLKVWLDTNAGKEMVFLSYSGTGEPDYYSINATRMPFLNLFERQNPWYEPQAGWYCISATILQQVYSSFKGDWNIDKEKQYQEERAKEPLFREYWRNPGIRDELQKMGSATAFEGTWKRYDQLRLARLCCYLRLRKPDASAGYSILIYHLSAAEVGGAVGGSPNDWPALIEKLQLKLD